MPAGRLGHPGRVCRVAADRASTEKDLGVAQFVQHVLGGSYRATAHS